LKKNTLDIPTAVNIKPTPTVDVVVNINADRAIFQRFQSHHKSTIVVFAIVDVYVARITMTAKDCVAKLKRSFAKQLTGRYPLPGILLTLHRY